MTKVLNWVRKLKMATIKENAGWKGFRSTGEPNKLNIKLWEVAKDEQVLSEEQRVRVPTEWCHLRNKQHQQSEYPASQAEAKGHQHKQ